MKKLLLGALFALLPLTGFAATILGFQAGVGNWTHDPSGSITADASGVGNTSADLKNDLRLSSKSEGYYYFLLEHPIPIVPNVKFVSTKLSSAGSGAVSNTFTFNGQTYSAASNVTTSFVLDQTDTILYYEILDNDLVSLDIGLTAKMINGSANVTGATAASFSATIPMLYASAEISLPSDFSLAAEMSTISAAGNEITDFSAKVMYTTDFMLGVEAGVRTQTVKIDIDSVTASMQFSGIFAGVFYKF